MPPSQRGMVIRMWVIGRRIGEDRRGRGDVEGVTVETEVRTDLQNQTSGKSIHIIGFSRNDLTRAIFACAEYSQLRL